MKGQGWTAVILVNYNGWKDTLECLDSLSQADDSDFKVYICDNGSPDGSVKKIESYIQKAVSGWKERMVLLDAQKNLGFAGGCNLAINKALGDGAEYFLLLNNDTIVDRRFIAPLITALDNDPRVGAAGGKIYYYGDREHIWAAGGGFINPFTALSRHFGLNQMDAPLNSKPRRLDYITGCLLMVRRDVIEKAGLLDEAYFLYYEESDWQMRMKESGYRSLYVPESRIYHKVSASVKAENPVMKYYFVRNRFYFIMKNYSGLHRLISLAYTLASTFGRMLYQTFRGNRNKRALLWRAMKDAFMGRMGEMSI